MSSGEPNSEASIRAQAQWASYRPIWRFLVPLAAIIGSIWASWILMGNGMRIPATLLPVATISAALALQGHWKRKFLRDHGLD